MDDSKPHKPDALISAVETEDAVKSLSRPLCSNLPIHTAIPSRDTVLLSLLAIPRKEVEVLRSLYFHHITIVYATNVLAKHLYQPRHIQAR